MPNCGQTTDLKREHDVDRHRRQDFAAALGCAADAGIRAFYRHSYSHRRNQPGPAHGNDCLRDPHCQRSHCLHFADHSGADDGRFRVRCLCFRLGHRGNFGQSLMPWLSHGRDPLSAAVPDRRRRRSNTGSRRNRADLCNGVCNTDCRHRCHNHLPTGRPDRRALRAAAFRRSVCVAHDRAWRRS
jgi:hypothetical protein